MIEFYIWLFVIVAWFTATNHYIRGITEGVDAFKWVPLWVGKILGKYTWCGLSGLVFWPTLGMYGAAIVAVGLVLGVWKGAEFTVLHIKERRGYWFWRAVTRGLWFVPLFAGLAVWYEIYPVALLGFWSALMYSVTSAVINPFYDERTTWAEAVSQTLFGLTGLGLPLAGFVLWTATN